MLLLHMLAWLLARAAESKNSAAWQGMLAGAMLMKEGSGGRYKLCCLESMRVLFSGVILRRVSFE